MKDEPTKREWQIMEGRATQVPDETLPHPKKLHWWQKLGAKITLALGTITGRNGGG